MATKTLSQMAEEQMLTHLQNAKKRDQLLIQARELRDAAYKLEREAAAIPTPSNGASSYAASVAAKSLFGSMRLKTNLETGDQAVMLEDTRLAQLLRYMQLKREPVRRKTLLDLYDLKATDLNGVCDGTLIRVKMGENPGFSKPVRYVHWIGPSILDTIMAIPVERTASYSQYAAVWDDVVVFWERKLDEGSEEAATWLNLMATVQNGRDKL